MSCELSARASVKAHKEMRTYAQGIGDGSLQQEDMDQERVETWKRDSNRETSRREEEVGGGRGGNENGRVKGLAQQRQRARGKEGADDRGRASS